LGIISEENSCRHLAEGTQGVKWSGCNRRV